MNRHLRCALIVLAGATATLVGIPAAFALLLGVLWLIAYPVAAVFGMQMPDAMFATFYAGLFAAIGGGLAWTTFCKGRK